jgi:hypothetical protein
MSTEQALVLKNAIVTQIPATDELNVGAGITSTTGASTMSGLTTAAMTGAGQAGYLSGASTLTPTDNATLAKSRMFGVYQGNAGEMQIAGEVAAALFTTAGGAPANGAPVYLAAAADDGATGAGKLTATAPVAGFLAEVGLCVDNANYAGAKTCKVLLQPKNVIAL